MTIDSVMLCTGSANRVLAADIASCLNMSLSNVTVGRFSDGEVMVELQENVRGKEAFIIQSLCMPVNDNLMELLVIADALRRASANRVTALIPYMGYTRQDRRPRSARVPITAKVVANMIGSVGIDRVLTVDLHADQIQGFFDMPLENLYSSPVLLGDVWKHEYPELVVVSPDVGGVVRARALAKRLDDTDLAIIDKRRPNPNESEVMNIIGDVQDRTCVIIDDLVVTDPIPLRPDAAACKKIRQLSVAAMLAESIRRVAERESLSSMFVD